MTASYSGNPAGSELDEVRFLLSDTDVTDALMTDSEINFLLDTNGQSALQAAILGAEILSGRFARLAGVTRRIGDLTVAQSQSGQAAEYRALAGDLRKRALAQSGAGVVFVPAPMQFTTAQFDDKG